MRALILGCGYLGSRLGAELASLGHTVWGVRRTREAESELRAAGITPLQGDVTNPETFSAFPKEFDWVALCASASGGAPEDYRRAYLEGARNVIHWLASKPPRKFVFTGSTSVYGQTDGSLVDETSPTEPQTETGRILVEAEALLLDAARVRGLPVVLLRLAGIYGPGRGYWLKQFLSGQARLEEGGRRFLNMIHRDDAAGAAIAALARGRPGEVYNVVDDEPVSQLALFNWLSEKTGRPMPPEAPRSSRPPTKRGNTNKRVSNRKLRTQLGYALRYPTFREGFTEELGLSGKGMK